jgi:hypothetical protein
VRVRERERGRERERNSEGAQDGEGDRVDDRKRDFGSYENTNIRVNHTFSYFPIFIVVIKNLPKKY